MIKSGFLARLTGFFLFYRWHPEVALRYLPLVGEIKKLGNEPKILEVGSGGLGITPYLRKEVTGVDLEFSPPSHPLLKKVKASATKLPFKKSSFDVVLSVDTLEHLEGKDRERAISEMIRVARKKILIAVPCGKDSFYEDLLLAEFVQGRKGEALPFLEDHLQYGLPEKEEVNAMILEAARQNKKTICIIMKGNENINLHRFLLKGEMTNNFLVDFFFRKVLLFAIPLLRQMNKEPTYRQLFFVDMV